LTQVKRGVTETQKAKRPRDKDVSGDSKENQKRSKKKKVATENKGPS